MVKRTVKPESLTKGDYIYVFSARRKQPVRKKVEAVYTYTDRTVLSVPGGNLTIPKGKSVEAAI